MRKALVGVGILKAHAGKVTTGIGDQVVRRSGAAARHRYGEEGGAATPVAHGYFFEGEPGLYGIVHDVKTRRQAGQAQTHLKPRGAPGVGKVQRGGLCAAHGKRSEQHLTLFCGTGVLPAFQQRGMEGQEFPFLGGTRDGNRRGAARFVEGEGDKVTGFQRGARGGVHQHGVIRHAVQLHEQAALEAQQPGGGGAVGGARRQPEISGVDRQRARSVVAVGETLLKGVLAVLRLAAEHVNVQRGDGVLFRSGDGAPRRGRESQLVVQGEEHFTPLRTTGDIRGSDDARILVIHTFAAARGKQQSSCH